MLQRLGIVFMIFMGLVVLNYIGTALFSGLGSSSGASALPFSIGGALGPGISRGLTAVHLRDFGTNESGRNYVTQGYGNTPYAYLYVGRWHNGIDIAATYGAPIYSPGEGVVVATGNQDNFCPSRGFGKFVAVRDGANGLVLWYAHLGTIMVSPGETVTPDEKIATVGMTGFETGTHLHFSIFKESGFTIKNKNGCGPDADGRDVDPLPYLGTVYN